MHACVGARVLRFGSDLDYLGNAIAVATGAIMSEVGFGIIGSWIMGNIFRVSRRLDHLYALAL